MELSKAIQMISECEVEDFELLWEKIKDPIPMEQRKTVAMLLLYEGITNLAKGLHMQADVTGQSHQSAKIINTAIGKTVIDFAEGHLKMTRDSFEVVIDTSKSRL